MSAIVVWYVRVVCVGVLGFLLFCVCVRVCFGLACVFFLLLLQNVKILCQKGFLCVFFMTQIFVSDCVLYQKVNDYREVMCLLLSGSVLVDAVM